MKAMILAAGRGERMLPLTENTPKPLLEIKGESLLAHHLRRLKENGITDVVINVHHHAEKIMSSIGDGHRYGLRIIYSVEKTLLNTGGGIANALSKLGDLPFIVINGDIWTDYPYRQLSHCLTENKLAHLVMVPNPSQHPLGDFVLEDGHLFVPNSDEQTNRFTFSGIGVYSPDLFKIRQEKSSFGLGALLREQILGQQVSGELYQGQWNDVGTPQRWYDLKDSTESGEENDKEFIHKAHAGS